MTTTEIRPALSAVQWAQRHLIVQAEFYGDDDMPSKGQAAAEIIAGPDYLHITEHQHPRFAVIDTPAQRHALAALALHGQPFGFSRDDVFVLRMVVQNAWLRIFGEGEVANARLTSLADRIAALLPPSPEHESTPTPVPHRPAAR